MAIRIASRSTRVSGEFAADQPLAHPLVHQRLDHFADTASRRTIATAAGSRRATTALPWIIGILSTVSSKYSTDRLAADQDDAGLAVDQHRRLAGRVQVDELVAPLPRIFAHQLMRDALLAEDQPDLAGKGTERELVQLPHGRAALARAAAAVHRHAREN